MRNYSNNKINSEMQLISAPAAAAANLLRVLSVDNCAEKGREGE